MPVGIISKKSETKEKEEQNPYDGDDEATTKCDETRDALYTTRVAGNSSNSNNDNKLDRRQSSSSSSRRGSSSSLKSRSLRGNLMRKQKSGRNPLSYYEVVQTLGIGSMGSVSKVKKHDHVVGGSSRRELCEKENTAKELCFQIPIVGKLVQHLLREKFCKCDSLLSINSANSSNKNGGGNKSFGGGCVVSPEHTESTRSLRSSYGSSTGGENGVVGNETTAAVRTTQQQQQQEFYYAMKSIHLNRIGDKAFIAELKNEIKILKSLDHPHIVRPIETFEHHHELFVVMELCSGGDLYARDPYTEEEAARIISQILSALSYMHEQKIVHRDIKYENCMFVNHSEKSDIKLIDFGLSKAYASNNQTLSDGVGTIYTMSPEVLKGSYTSQADLWSVGVVAYMLLSSQMPFYGRKRRHVVEALLKGEYEFKGRRWKRVSRPAKQFVEDLLVLNPEDRATAEEALQSTWLNRRRYAATTRAPNVEEMDQIQESIKQYSDYSKMKKLALTVIAHKSNADEIGILRKVFQQYDTKKNGKISLDEFKDGLSSYGYDDDELSSMFEAVDLDGTGKIRYTEFLAATIEARGVINEERLAEAFDRLDSDDSGYITKENLKSILGDDMPAEELEEIIEEVDITKDGKLAYHEFLALWENKEEDKRKERLRELGPRNSTLSTSTSDYDNNNLPYNLEFSEQEKRLLQQESIEDNSTLSRANFLEEKQHSERRASTAPIEDQVLTEALALMDDLPKNNKVTFDATSTIIVSEEPTAPSSPADVTFFDM